MNATVPIAALVFISGAWTLSAADEEGKPPSPLDFTLEREDGKSHKLAGARGGVTVLEWARPDCPCTLDYYKGALPGLQSEMRGRSVKWFVVLPVKKSAPAAEREKLTALLKDAGSKPDLFLFDPGFAMTDALGINILPHVIILDEIGNTAYSGALDTECNPPTTSSGGVLKSKREILPQSEKRDHLRESLNNLLSGVPITDKSTKTKGCLMQRFKFEPAPVKEDS